MEKLRDSVQEETLAVFATEVIVHNEHIRPLMLQKRRHRLTEESHRKFLVPGEKVPLEGKVRKRAKVTSKEIARIRCVIIGILPYVKLTHLNRDANSATLAFSDTLKMMDSSIKKVKEKWWKGSVVLLKDSKQLDCVSQDTHPPEKSFLWNWKLGSNCVVTLSQDATSKNRERKGPSQGMVQKCEPQERNPCASQFEDRTLKETLQRVGCARREAWDFTKF